MKYDVSQIAKELTATALGQAYYGNALRVAKDIHSVTDEERSCLDRWATGAQTNTDGWELQRLAMKIEEYDDTEDLRDLNGLRQALEFLDKCKNDKSAGETGALRDAWQWLEEAARQLVRRAL